jgi:hypothetical protein
MMRFFLLAVLTVLVGFLIVAAPASAQYPCAGVYAYPAPTVDTFVGSSYSFVQPGYASYYYYPYTAYYPGYAGTYSVPAYTTAGYAAFARYQARYENPGPYYYTTNYAFTPGYYSYYYTPGYFRY